MTRATLSILSLAFLVLGSCKNEIEPSAPDYHNKLLFASSRSGKEQLYAINPEGTEIRQLTSGRWWHGHGRWSPEATRIVCNTEERTTTAGLEMVVMNVDGSNRRHLGWGSRMAWLRDGRKIVFVYFPSFEIGVFDAALYIIDSDGKNRTLLSVDFASEAAFSPVGNTVAFVYVNRFDPIPLPMIKLTDYPKFENVRSVGPIGATHPAWSPNGREIAFTMKPEGRAFHDIFVMDTSGQALHQVTKHQSSEHFYFPRWSPEGNRIAFISYVTEGLLQRYLYMVNRDGTNLQRVLDDSTVTSVDWSW